MAPSCSSEPPSSDITTYKKQQSTGYIKIRWMLSGNCYLARLFVFEFWYRISLLAAGIIIYYDDIDHKYHIIMMQCVMWSHIYRAYGNMKVYYDISIRYINFLAIITEQETRASKEPQSHMLAPSFSKICYHVSIWIHSYKRGESRLR